MLKIILSWFVPVAQAVGLPQPPSPTTLIDGIGDVASPWFEELAPWMYLALGIIVVFGLLKFLPALFSKIFHH